MTVVSFGFGMDTLTWLQDWYSRQCNDDWEHSWGVKIDNIDNPGWMVTINLIQTNLQEKSFEKVAIKRSETDWLQCWAQDAKFKIVCGPKNLQEALEVFRSFTTT